MPLLDGLTEDSLLAAAGATSFERGEDYVRQVQGLRVVGASAEASIQGSSAYLVELEWSRTAVDGHCTCPHYARGNFCKHLVALGLAVIDSAQESAGTSDTGTRKAGTGEYVAQLDEGALRDLVLELAARDEGVAHVLEIRAAALLGDGGVAAEELVTMVNGTLRSRGSVDYHRSFEVAQDAHGMLDELEDHLDAGAAGVVRPALLRAVTRLQSILGRADDSSGSIGDACQRAVDLYARACRAGHPDPVKLARWLVRFRDESPDWPQVTLADFVEAFDEQAMAAYRKGVAGLTRKYAGQSGRRSEVDAMRLELADHDEDLDAALAVLSDAERPQYGLIVDRLRLAGRFEDVTTWVDRAVAAGAVSSHAGSLRSHWLDPDEVAGEYLALDRVDDALEVFRTAFRSNLDPEPYGALMSFAERIDRQPEMRAWADELLREHASRTSNGGFMVRIALAEGDVEAAWAAADEFGVGYFWEPLAKALVEHSPSRAATLYRTYLDSALNVSDASRYEELVKKLGLVRDLSLAAGEEREFAAYLFDIREKYKRRRSLMAALDRHRL